MGEPRPNSRKLRAALGWLVSLAVLVFVVRAVEWGEVVAKLGAVRYALLVPLTLVAAVHFMLRAWRWRYLLPGGEEVPYRALHDTLLLGNMANYLLPLRAGEVLRPLLLARRSSQTFPVALVSVVIERFFDLSAVLLMFGLLIAVVPGVPDMARSAAVGLGLVALALLGFVLVGGLRPGWVTVPTALVLRPLPERLRARVLDFVEHLLEGARVLRSPRRLVLVVATTALVWGTCYLYFLCGLWMFEVERPGWPALAVAVMVALAVAFPSAPGFIGVFQAGCLVALGLFGVAEELGVAYSLVVHAHQFAYICGVGAVILVLGGASLGQLRALGQGQAEGDGGDADQRV